MLNHCEESALTCGNLYNLLHEHLSVYHTLCEQYQLTAKELTDMEQVTTYVGMETPDMWLTDFYQGLLQIFTANPAAAVAREAAVVTGFLRKASLDFRKTYLSLEEQLHYQEPASALLHQFRGGRPVLLLYQPVLPGGASLRGHNGYLCRHPERNLHHHQQCRAGQTAAGRASAKL